MKRTLELTVGPSCSGKTTYAEKKVKTSGGTIVNLNRDELRQTLFSVKLADYKFTKEKENLVTNVQLSSADVALGSGKSVIISDTNLDPNRWVVWKELAVKHGIDFTVRYFSVPLDELLVRNMKRDYSVPENVIRTHVTKFEQNFPDKVDYFLPKPYTRPEQRKQKAYIVDIDGTLAHMNGKRGPFEWSNVGVDDVDESVRDTVNELYKTNMIIIMSGRDEVCREETEAWLDENNISYDHLFMRKQGDHRKDYIIKDELFEEHVAGKYDIVAVFDDRNCVVELWRKKGLKCYQVEYGFF